MEIFEEDVQYLRYFKVALAISIIRQKPKNLTAKHYTEDLAAVVRQKDQNSQKKIEHLQIDLFQAKQKLVQSQLASRCDVGNEVSYSDVNKNKMVLTPPHTFEDKINKIESSSLLGHAHFLKSVSFFCKKPLDLASVFASDDVTVVKETLLKINEMLTQDSGSKMLLLPPTVIQSCANGIKDVLESLSIRNYQTELKVPILSLVEYLIQMIINTNENTLQVQKSDQICNLIVLLGCTPCLRNDTLTKLTSSVLEVSSKLRDVTQGGSSLRTVLTKYHNVYHTLWAIERILTRTSTTPCPQTTKTRLTVLMEESLLHLSRSFPVFASYVWTIQALLR